MFVNMKVIYKYHITDTRTVFVQTHIKSLKKHRILLVNVLQKYAVDSQLLPKIFLDSFCFV